MRKRMVAQSRDDVAAPIGKNGTSKVDQIAEVVLTNTGMVVAQPVGKLHVTRF
jgi:hypothetical protein